MKKLLFIAAIAATLTACSGGSSTEEKMDLTTEERKDMIDSSADAKKDMIDSSADAKKDMLDSTNKMMKDTAKGKM